MHKRIRKKLNRFIIQYLLYQQNQILMEKQRESIEEIIPRYKKKIEFNQLNDKNNNKELQKKGNKLFKRAYKLFYQRNLDEAQKVFKECSQVQLLYPGRQSVQYAKTISNIGLIQSYKLNYDQALNYLEQSLKITQKTDGKINQNYAKTLNKIANIYLSKGDDLNKVMSYLEQVLKIRQTTVGKEHQNYGRTLTNIGIVYHDKKQYQNALINYQNARKIYQKTIGKNCFDYARVLNSLGKSYDRLGQINTAFGYCSQSIQIMMKTNNQKHPYFQEFENNLKQIKDRHLIYKFQHHQEFFQCPICKIDFDSDKRIPMKPCRECQYIVCSKCLRQKIKKHNQEGSFNKCYQCSLELIRENMAICKGLIGFIDALKKQNIQQEDHNQALNSKASKLFKKAYTQLTLNNLDLAQEMFIECLNIQKQYPGIQSRQYARTLNNLALVEQLKQNFDIALTLFEQSLNINQKLTGKTNQAYEGTLQNIGGIYQVKGDLNKAMNCYQQVLKIRQTTIGKQHQNYAKTLLNIAVICCLKKQFQNAFINYQNARKIYEKTIGKNCFDYANLLNNIGATYQHINQLQKAFEYCSQGLQIMIKTKNQKHPYFPGFTRNIQIITSKLQQKEQNEKVKSNDKAKSK